MKQIYITNTECSMENGRPIIHLYGRDKDHESEHIEVFGFEPYFYVRPEEADEISAFDHENIERYEETEFVDIVDQGELTKVVVDDPYKLRDVAELFDKTFEADVDPTNRFRIDNGIKTGVKAPSNRVDVSEIEAIEMEAPPRVMTFDIETDDRGEGFPEYGKARILSIVAHDSYTDEYVGFIDMEGKSLGDRFPDAELNAVEHPSDLGLDRLDQLNFELNEKRMLISFYSWISGRDFDILAGWNSNGFDTPFVVERADEVGSNSDRMARNGSSGLTWRNDPYVNGRSCFDFMEGWKDTKFTKVSGSLDSAAEMELDDAKIDHQEKGFYELYDDNTKKFLNYNTKDVHLTIGIDNAANVLGFKTALRNTIGLDYEDTNDNKDFITMMVRRELRDQGYVGPTADPPEDAGSYDGAFVFEAFNELKENIVGIDLASLYPNALWMLNASPETKLGKIGRDFKREWVDRILDEGYEVSVSSNGVVFCLEEDGIFRKLVDDALKLKEHAGEMKEDQSLSMEERDEWAEEYAVRKTIVNSIYGVLGWVRFFLYDKDIASAITLTSQEIIKSTADHVNENTEAEVAYGDTDSVPAKEPVLVRDSSGNIEYVEIQHLDGKEGKYQVWTEDGFTNIKTVWKKPNRKQNYTIRTKNGLVHTTEDHSLVRDGGSIVKPGELTEGDHLLHRDVSEAMGDGEETMSTDRAWLYGFFAADGSSGIYDSTVNGCDVKKNGFALNKNDTDLLEQAKLVLKSEFGVNSQIYDYRESSGVQKLQLTNNDEVEWGGVNEVIDHFVNISYTESREKCVPREVLNGTDEIVEAFLDGYMGGDGYVGERYTKRFHEASTKDLHLASGLTMLLQRLGYTFNIDYRRNHDSEYYRIRCQKYHRGNPEELCSVEEYDYDGEYVYDIETENHHFQAGAGNLIVHNSNYIEFNSSLSQQECLEKAEEICADLNNEVYLGIAEKYGMPTHIDGVEWPTRFEIELEMYASHFFQSGSKKFYAYTKTWAEGMDFADQINDGEGKLSISGYPCVKANTAKLTKQVQRDTLEAIVRGEDENTIREIIKDGAASIDPSNPDMDLIGIPGGLGKELTDYSWSDGTPSGASPRAAYYGNLFVPKVNFGKDDTVKRVYLDGVNAEKNDRSYKLDVIGFERAAQLDGCEPTLNVDVPRMQDTLIKTPMEDILNAVEIDINAAISGQEQKGLAAF